MIVTWEEALADREARGFARARARSKARGQLKGVQEVGIRVARHRFGSLPAQFEERIRAIDDLDRLWAIFDQILEVASLDEIELS